MTGYLIRVGLDTGSIGGGGHAPIHRDGSFDYIPIPEDAATIETETYDSYPTRLGKSASQFTEKSGDVTVHRDPEFETYTYGEVGTKKRQSLRKLSKGDLLVFYSSLQPLSSNGNTRLYIIGYFTVDEVADLEEMTPEERAETLQSYSNNAHAKRELLTPEQRTPGRDNYPVIVSGDPDNSELLKKSLPLTSSRFTVSTSVDYNSSYKWYQKYRPLLTSEEVLGINATDLTRSMPKKIRANSETIRAWLEGNYTVETKARGLTPKHYHQNRNRSDSKRPSGAPNARGYVMAHDTGFAPHVNKGLLSLATCAPSDRSSAKVGDWVFAVGDKTYSTQRELVYAFRVEYIVDMSTYYTDHRFQTRKPIPRNQNPAGDNIYAPRSVVKEISTIDGAEVPDEVGAEAGTTYEKGTIDEVRCYSHSGGDYFQLRPGYHDLSNYKTDLEKQGDRENVLLSSEYYYFGENAETVPQEVAELVVPGIGDHNSRNAGRVTRDSEHVTEFVSWLRSNFRVGTHGTPKHASAESTPDKTTGPGC